LRGGFGVLATPGPIWAGDLTGWPAAPTGGATWQAPVALTLLAVAAGILLPAPWKDDVAGAAVVLATIGTPAAFDLPWWSPVQVGGAAAGAARLTLLGAVAALAAEFDNSAQVILTAALAASSLGLAAVAAVRRQVPQYLPYASVAVVGGATVSALAALFTGLP